MTIELSTRVCIAGGGLAALMLGFLLVRAGVAVAILETHKKRTAGLKGL